MTAVPTVFWDAGRNSNAFSDVTAFLRHMCSLDNTICSLKMCQTKDDILHKVFRKGTFWVYIQLFVKVSFFMLSLLRLSLENKTYLFLLWNIEMQRNIDDSLRWLIIIFIHYRYFDANCNCILHLDFCIQIFRIWILIKRIDIEDS